MKNQILLLRKILDYTMTKQTKEQLKDKYLYKKYGITFVEWHKLYYNQSATCAICKILPKNKILCVDHIHIRGFKKMSPEEKRKYIRGLVCFCCNTAFGRIERRKNPRQLLENINKYFEVHKMKGDKID